MFKTDFFIYSLGESDKKKTWLTFKLRNHPKTRVNKKFYCLTKTTWQQVRDIKNDQLKKKCLFTVEDSHF